MEKINILFVEDNPLDAELLNRYLKSGGIEFDSKLVESLHEVEKALQANEFNFLISDYSLPGFTGIDVIKLVKSKGLDIPVILVSGSVPDETAIDAVLLGAKDYVLKDNLKRLVPAVKREVEALYQRQERELNELFVNSLFESLVGIRISDRDRNIVRVNETYCDMVGYKTDELIGKNLDMLIPTERLDEDRKKYSNYFKKKRVPSSEYREIRKDGSFVDLIVSSHVVRNRNNEFVISTFQDVTEALRVNEIFEKVSQQASIGGWERDLINDKVFWTDGIFDIYGIKDGVIPKFDTKDIAQYFPREGSELLRKSLNRVIETGEASEIELELVDRSGKLKWIKNTTAPLIISGKVVKLYGAFQDVTDQKEREIDIERSKNTYKYLFDNNPNPLLLIDDLGTDKIIGVNQAAIELYGYSREEFVGMSPVEMRPKEDVAEYKKALSSRHNSNKEIRNLTQTRHFKKNGDIIFVEVHWKRINLNGLKSRIVLINDVTEKTMYERELVKTNSVLKTLIDAAPLAVITTNIDGIVDDVWNQKAEEILGWKSEEVFGKFIPFIPKEEIEGVKRKFKTKEASIEEIKRITKDGNTITIKKYMTPIKGKNGDMDKILLLIEDITEQNKIELALIESEQKYRNLVEASHDLIWRIDGEGNFNFVNDASLEILGYETSELIGNKFNLFVEPELKEDIIKLHSDVMNGKSFDNFDLRMTRKDGNITHLSAKSYPVRDNNGLIIACTGTATDITTILEYQNQLEDSLLEKEVLIKEIHHRVKNNLAVISGLFALQSMSIKDDEIVQIFNESQARIKSIATIHEKLYQNELFTSIEIKSYLGDLLEDIRKTYFRSGKDIDICLEGDEVTLNVNQAVPFGILANELITNSFKYAFPDNNKGEITLSVTKVKNEIVFQARDNGIGLPEHFEEMKHNSLGMTLIESLRSQLDGTIIWKSKNGTTFELRFEPSEMRTWKDSIKPK